MKLPFIFVVAAFLLRSVIAERNGRTNILVTSRRSFNDLSGENQTRYPTGGGITNHRNEHVRSNGRKRPAFKSPGIPRSARTSRRKFPGIVKTGNPFIGGYTRNQKSKIWGPRKFPKTKFNLARRVLDLHADSDHFSIPRGVQAAAIFLEPVLREKPKNDIFARLLGKDLFSSDSSEELGPMIGPLDLPEIGRNVYIRLISSPGKETASHVTVHLVNKSPGTLASSDEIFESPEFPHYEKPAEFLSGEKYVAPPLIGVKKSPAYSDQVNQRKNRYVEKSVRSFGPPPFRREPPELFRIKNLQDKKVPQDMFYDRPPRLGNSPEYYAAWDHHQLPVAHRPTDNLVDLPIYPPLTAEDFRFKEDAKRVENKSEIHTGIESVEDTQQAASSKQTLVSPHFSTSSAGWQFVRLSANPGQVVSRREETSEPIFMREIKAPDLSSGNVSAIISDPENQYNLTNLRAEISSGTTRAAIADRKDENVTLPHSIFGSRHPTTSTTSHAFSQDDGSSGTTTPIPSSNLTGGRAPRKKKKLLTRVTLE